MMLRPSSVAVFPSFMFMNRLRTLLIVLLMTTASFAAGPVPLYGPRLSSTLEERNYVAGAGGTAA